MAACKDLEAGTGDLSEPLILHKKEEEEEEVVLLQSSNNERLWMVYLCTFVAVCGSFEFGSCVGFTAPTEVELMDELKLSPSQYSFFGSVLTLGGMLGAITSGSIANFIGRKGALRISSVCCIGGWLAIYLSVNFWLLDIGRFSTGFGIGTISYVVPVYIAEISPRELRGTLSTLNQALLFTGMTVSFIIGTFAPWRRVALTGIIPCMVLLVGLYFVPESPRWLAMSGRQKEFEAALLKLRGADTDISKEVTELTETVMALQLLPKATVLDLLEKGSIQSVIVGGGLMVFQQFSGYNGIVFYAGQIFRSAGVSPNAGNILYGTVQVIATIFGAGLIDKAGRRPLLLVSLFGLFLGSLMTGTCFFLKANHLASEVVPVLAITGILVYMASYSIGLGSIPWIIMSEVFPANTQGIGGSMVSLVNWFCSWSVSFSFTQLMNWSSYGTFFLFAAVCAAGSVFIIRVVPETKGRTLQEIQDAMD